MGASEKSAEALAADPNVPLPDVLGQQPTEFIAARSDLVDALTNPGGR